jgi:putative oxidoreductase
VLVAIIFIVSGFGKVVGFDETVAVANSAGLPLPAIAIAIAALIEIAAGLALFAGWRTRWASLALLVFLIPATLLFHAAHLGNPAQGRMQMIEVLKNLAIMGGLLKFYLDGSVEARAEARPEVEVEDFRTRRAS